MSRIYYNELWLIARSDLEKLLELERSLQENAWLKKKGALNSALSIYLRYVFKLISHVKYFTCICNKNL